MTLAEIEERLRRIARQAESMGKNGVVETIRELADEIERARLLAPPEARQ